MAGTFFLKQTWRSIIPEGRRRARAGRAREPGPRQAGAPRRGRTGYGEWATGATSAAGPRSPAARAGGRGPGPGLDSAAARYGNRSAGPGSGARRQGQRRCRLSLLLPPSLLRRVLVLAGSPPPPPQPRRSSGFVSPSRPGRPAGTIPESEGLLPFPAAVGGHL